MPVTNTSYFNNIYEQNTDSVYADMVDDGISYGNSDNNSVNHKYEVFDIVYANTTEPITPRKIWDKFVKQTPELVGSRGIDEDFFLSSLEDEIIIFAAQGLHKWNFLSVEQTINLQNGHSQYTLPSNFDQMIAVWLDRDSSLNNTGHKIEILEIDHQKKNFANGINFYSRKGYELQLINLDTNIEECDSCGCCANCQKYNGTLKLHYHIKPQAPKTMEDSMSWFPAHPNLLSYFVQKIKAVAYEKAGMPPIINSNLEVLWTDLLRWDMNFLPSHNKLDNDMKLFNFNKVFRHRR